MSGRDAFFEARWDGRRTVVRGTADCQLGRGDGYAGWRWDGHTLEAFNDRYGLYPLFYSHVDDTIRISGSLERLLREGTPATLDYDALAVLLRLQHCVGEDTPFEHIRVVPPDAKFSWRAGTLGVSGVQRIVPAAAVSFDQAVDGFSSLFEQSIQRRLPEGDDVVLPLSGGRDSRHILFRLCKAGRSPRSCVTLYRWRPSGHQNDALLAARVANAAGVRHAVVEQPDNRVEAARRRDRLTDFCTWGHSQFVVLVDYLRERTRVSYDGIAGDLLTVKAPRHRYSESQAAMAERGDWTGLARSLIPPMPFLKKVLRPEVYDSVSLDRAIARVARELPPHQEAANPGGSFRFWHRTRRLSALVPFGLYRGIDMRVPFLDHDLYDFLSSIPVRVLDGAGLQDAVIRRDFPRYADLPFDTNEAVNRSAGAYGDYSTMTARLRSAFLAGRFGLRSVREVVRVTDPLVRVRSLALRTALSIPLQPFRRGDVATYVFTPSIAAYLAHLTATARAHR